MCTLIPEEWKLQISFLAPGLTLDPNYVYIYIYINHPIYNSHEWRIVSKRNIHAHIKKTLHHQAQICHSFIKLLIKTTDLKTKIKQ